ncbi:MAG: tRNA (adenosine(37)-N6)-threonylcarbamoyltransferase complex transferase subunit TsaD [Clostridia bacterium]|nr:tRNA (adenosine(37)-N6)-threonylcarbamoyltransferase complex transferase subunit TsaD [Clostridia bacterium]
MNTASPVRILALESSCDETAAAIVENGRVIRANVVFSQIDLHALYGGVVPEIASRAHVEACDRVIDEALRQAGMTFGDIDALAVTYGPGLVGALLTGVSCMKGLSYALGKPLIPVNHIEGHIAANFLTHQDLEPPFLCLVVSGGHSHLVNVPDYATYELIGQTHDDAAGEAFDKAARVLGLPYPGGPRLDALAEEGDPAYLRLPDPRTEGRFDYSFSGVKTAFLNAVNRLEMTGQPLPKADLAASFRHAVVEQLVDRAMPAARETGAARLALAGGVSANRELRRRMTAACAKAGLPLYMPDLPLCGDNGAMIASAAYWRYLRGQTAPLTLNAVPGLRLVTPETKG